MKLGLGRGAMAGVFDLAQMTPGRRITMDGRRALDHIQPRLVREIPTQSEVAAWARGCATRAAAVGRFCYWAAAEHGRAGELSALGRARRHASGWAVGPISLRAAEQ